MEQLLQSGASTTGFFQQLLASATAGTLFEREIDLQGNIIEEPHSPPDEYYYAETESDPAATDAETTDQDDNVYSQKYKAVDAYVSSFNDPMSVDEFNYGRDLDTEYLERGIDDTVMDYFTEAETGADSIDDTMYAEHGQEHCEKEVDVLALCKDNDNKCDTSCNRMGSMLGDCGCAQQAIEQEISQIYLDDLAAGYKKRQKRLVESDTVDCRKAREMGAIEIAMRTSSTKMSDHIFEPVLGMVFDSKEEAYEFYNMYAWEVGFSIIYNCNRKRADGKYISMQEIICQKGGRDRRVKNATRKEKCKAKMVLLRNGDGGWFVHRFVKEHTHPLAESCSEKRNLGSHKRLDPYTLDVIKYLRKTNVSQTNVRCVLGSMFGSLKEAPCTKRSVRAICKQIAREQMENDLAKTIEIFKKMHMIDQDFKWSVERGSDNTINTIMWCTGKSREQYACFGDVVTFDTTYCTNVYKMPFGLFVGVNNHFQTIIFAGVLMRQETTESFKWVFNEFLTLMGNKAPGTVLTDQCKGMTIALAEVWTETFHLWCKWHVMKSIREGLGPLYTKNTVFRDEFYAIVNEMLTKEEFVCAWKDLCQRYKITENPFMVRTFQCRSKWARPWSKGHYCAGMTSTQRSESANMMLKKFVPRNSSMNVFVSQYNVLLEDRDMEEGRQENITKQVMVKKGRMWPIERHALKIYTRASFNLFKKQVDKAANFVVQGEGEGFYVVNHNYKEKMPEWKKTSFIVYVIQPRERYKCECGLYEHLGMLCCHIIRLLIRLDIFQIPEAHIMKRWTRDAKDMLPDHRREHQAPIQNDTTTSFHQFKMNNKALEVITKGNTDRETHEIVMKHLSAAVKEVDEILSARANNVNVSLAPLHVEDKSSTDCAQRFDVESDIDGVQVNKYGASGSSARMSDSEIENLRLPRVVRTRGQPKVNRHRSKAEVALKKTVHKRKKAGCSKLVPLNMLDEAIEPLEISPGLPYQSTFCSKCKQAGHTKKNCPGKSKKHGESNKEVFESEENGVTCCKCALPGHSSEECLVAEDEYNSFFR